LVLGYVHNYNYLGYEKEMSERLSLFIGKENDRKLKEHKEKILLKSRKEVDINGNGTSGYVIKQGSEKGRVLKHIQIKSKNI